MQITEYKSSKGPVPIATMPHSYAKNALAKLYREEPHRTAEIGALELHVRTLDENPPEAVAKIGDNNPPPEAVAAMSWDAIRDHMDDLLTEAGNWADGAAIASQQQADDVAKLRQLLQDADRLADKARVAEKKPLDDEIQKIQDRYNAYIAPMKNKAPGSVSKAVTALGNLLTPWLNKLADEKKAREDAARKEAEEAQAAALAAREQAKSADSIALLDEADALLDAADAAQKALKAVEREKVQAKGEYRAVGLRSTWSAVLIDGEGGKALKHYATTAPERVKAFLQSLADEDVKNGARAIPGFNIIEERKV